MKKSRKMLICRVFKAGLSVGQVAWAFQISESVVHRIIREML
jgi:transposase